MFENYLRSAVNNLVKNRLYTAINIIGLAIGLTACILIALYVRDQLSYDSHWVDADRIFRVNGTVEWNSGDPSPSTMTALPLIPALSEYFAEEITHATRITSAVQNLRVEGEAVFDVQVSLVDPGFQDIFQLDVIAGSLEQVLAGNGLLALREDTAQRIFGSGSALGKTLSLEFYGQEVVLEVRAIYRHRNNNSILNLAALTRLNEQSGMAQGLNNWFAHSAYSFVKLAEGASASDIARELPRFADQSVDISALSASDGMPPSERVQFNLQNIRDAYLNTPFQTSAPQGNRTIVAAFSVIAILILVIAGINFVVLTTAKATQRAQEVALRKLHGARRRQLIIQFMGESFFLVFLAMFVALGLTELLIPLFEQVVGKTLLLDYTEPAMLATLVCLFLAVGFLGGAYPALVLSGFRPAYALKANQSSETEGSLRMKYAMVVFQFAVSIALMVATFVVYTQVLYASGRDPGFDREGVIIIDDLFSRNFVNSSKQVLQDELEKLSNVEDTAFSALKPMSDAYNLGSYSRLEPDQAHPPVALYSEMVGEGFFSTLGIPLLAGRTFVRGRDQVLNLSEELSLEFEDPTASPKVVLNESALRALGFASAEEAIGGSIRFEDDGLEPGEAPTVATVIGVVRDVQYKSMHLPPIPMMYVHTGNYSILLSVRFSGTPQQAMNDIRNVWREVMGNEILKVEFLDQLVAAEFDRQRMEGRILVSFSLLAILIACLGLFGSATFSAERRTKEIGLRKVMGAKVRDIVRLLLWQFSVPVVIANLIAWPVALYAMSLWLEQFPYRIDTWVLLPMCLLAGVVACLIAGLTVASNTVHVARGNPVHALRSE